MKPTIKFEAARQTPIKPNGMQNMLVVSNRQGLLYFEHYEQLALREKLKFAEGIVKALLDRPFYTLISTSINTETHM